MSLTLLWRTFETDVLASVELGAASPSFVYLWADVWVCTSRMSFRQFCSHGMENSLAIASSSVLLPKMQLCEKTASLAADETQDCSLEETEAKGQD